MNFIFLSPNFPKTYWNFCRSLKNNGIRVLGIGDENYDALSQELRESIDEYFRVSSLENYEEVYSACAFFAYKYGRIDWIESNNEYWLERDARLRTDFNVNSGLKEDRISYIKYKSQMKKFYKRAGVPVARYHLVTNLKEGLAFVQKVGYPVIVKPDNGVGASATYRISNKQELEQFYNALPTITYIMEEYVDGTIVSYDGIAGKNKEIIFETEHIYPDSIMDLVNEQKDVWFYSKVEIDEDLKKIGRRVIQTFDTNSRFFHTEYFRLREDKPGLGKKGQLVGLEVNMRPPGGYIPDMIDFAHDISVYQIWANMIAYNDGRYDKEHKVYSSVYAAKRKQYRYVHSNTQIYEKYEKNIMMHETMPDVFANAMGDDAIMARFDDEKEAIAFAKFVLKRKKQ